jgi:type IV pilus assembly protein PilQ
MAFQQPDVERPEVRVVITRGPGERPLVTREGANVVVAFDSRGSAAQTPPAISGETGAAAHKALAQATAPGAPDMPASAEEGDALNILHEGGLLDGKQYVGRRISLDFKDVEIDDVLRLIAEVSDLNIIAGDDVSGRVTIRLVDVPWDQALDVILLTKSLGFVKVGNVLRIAPKAMLQSESESRLQERRAKEKLEDLVVKFQPVNYAAVGNVAKMVQRLLSARGTVNTDSRTNTVIIKDIPSVIDESVALIKAIDTPTPQVLIEAKIVEANLDFSRELGTVWGFGVQQLNDAFNTSSGVNPTYGSPNFNPHPDPRILSGTGDLNNFSVDNPISSVPTALVNLGAFLLDEKYNLEVQLQAAESTGEGKVISSPRVVTLDNREAEIQQGVAIPYQTFENGDAQLQFIDAVLSLRVKPHITADKSIIMKLEVTRDAPDDSVATGSVGAPAIAKNQAKTETLVRDGQTLVIGGIYTVQKGTRMSRVPYLWQIPVIGYAFRNNSIRDIRKELLIFVTPRIVDMPQLGS